MYPTSANSSSLGFWGVYLLSRRGARESPPSPDSPPIYLPRAECPVSGDVPQGPPGTLELPLLLGRQVGRPLRPGVEARALPAALDLLETPSRPARKQRREERKKKNRPKKRPIGEKAATDDSISKGLKQLPPHSTISLVGCERLIGL